MNIALKLILTVCVLLCSLRRAEAAAYVTDGGSGLGYRTIALLGSGLDSNFDNVLFTLEVTGSTSFTTLDLSLAGNGAGPGNYAILSGATFLPGAGIAPTAIQLNLLNGMPGDFYQCTFSFASPPLSTGLTSATLVLQYPLNSIAPLLPSTPFVLAWPNHGSSPSAFTISAAVPEPSSIILLATGALILGSGIRRRY